MAPWPAARLTTVQAVRRRGTLTSPPKKTGRAISSTPTPRCRANTNAMVSQPKTPAMVGKRRHPAQMNLRGSTPPLPGPLRQMITAMNPTALAGWWNLTPSIQHQFRSNAPLWAGSPMKASCLRLQSRANPSCVIPATTRGLNISTNSYRAPPMIRPQHRGRCWMKARLTSRGLMPLAVANGWRLCRGKTV